MTRKRYSTPETEGYETEAQEILCQSGGINDMDINNGINGDSYFG